MKINQLVQTNADIVTITTVKRGDVYKRLDEPSYGGPKLLFGVVTDVLANGETSVITALEVTASYDTVEVIEKVFAGGGEVQLYPAQPEEFTEHRARMIEASERSVATKRRELDRAQELYARVRDLVDLEITAAETSTLAVEA